MISKLTFDQTAIKFSRNNAADDIAPALVLRALTPIVLEMKNISV